MHRQKQNQIMHEPSLVQTRILSLKRGGDLSTILAHFLLSFQIQEYKSKLPITDALLSSLAFYGVRNTFRSHILFPKMDRGCIWNDQKEAQGNFAIRTFLWHQEVGHVSMVLNGLSRPCHNTPFTGKNRPKSSSATLKVPRVEKGPVFVDSSMCVCFETCASAC
jgi:hypothetical protein